MTVLAAVLTIVVAAGSIVGLLPAALPSGEAGAPAGNAAFIVCAVALVGYAALSLAFPRSPVNWRLPASGVLGLAGLAILLHSLDLARSPAGFWGLVLAVWAIGWIFVERLSALEPRAAAQQLLLALAVPAVFGAWILFLWEVLVRGLDVPSVLLPAPSAIATRFAASTDILWADFQQTFMKAVLAGYALGCGAGLAVSILIDRSGFLKRGLLPIGNFVSALPIIGVAPIMVMWFGFDWHSKAAVVVVMTFFPMLVNTVSGLAASSAIERDLMRTYAAGYWQTLFKLRIPQALPFIFNALKINSTLALIGAIVAEFFGTPIVGMGFRISTEVGRLNVDMVWAEIAVAAAAGSLFYFSLTVIERLVTFWHPSYRQ